MLRKVEVAESTASGLCANQTACASYRPEAKRSSHNFYELPNRSPLEAKLTDSYS